MTKLKWPSKDPDELLDYSIDWTDRLAGDEITTSEWIVPSGLVKDSDSNTESMATVWLSGGDLGENYLVTNRINTVGGRIMDQSVSLKIVTK